MGRMWARRVRSTQPQRPFPRETAWSDDRERFRQEEHPGARAIWPLRACSGDVRWIIAERGSVKVRNVLRRGRATLCVATTIHGERCYATVEGPARIEEGSCRRPRCARSTVRPRLPGSGRGRLRGHEYPGAPPRPLDRLGRQRLVTHPGPALPVDRRPNQASTAPKIAPRPTALSARATSARRRSGSATAGLGGSMRTYATGRCASA